MLVASRLLSKLKTISRTKQTVFHGDCLKGLTTLPSNSVDIVITSPPYNIGVKYRTYNDKMEKSHYLEWLHQIFSEVQRILKDDGSLFLNVGSTNNNPWLAYDAANNLRDLFMLQNHIIWVKSLSIGETTYGHFKPINSPRFTNNTYEDIFHFTKNGDVWIDRLSIGVPYMDKSNIAKKKDSRDLRCRGNCWFIPYETICNRSEKGNHPAIFPEKIAEWCIKLVGYNDDTVVCDPFLGTGTTLVVAEQLGVNGFGIELDTGYLEYAEQRIAAA
jgi:site-specific DNA-methyltransferase (adenine-specific)